MVGAIFIPLFYILFIYSFLNKKIKTSFYIILYGSAFVLFILNFTSLIVKKIVANKFFNLWPIAGPAYPFFLAFFGLIFFFSLFVLYKEFFLCSGVKKTQIKFLFFGVAIGLIGAITNYPLWFNINIPPVGNIFVSAFAGFTAYAIIAHRLMDIKVVLRKSTVYTASLLTILIPAIVIRHFINYNNTSVLYFSDLIILIASITFFAPIKNFYYRLANKYFFTSLYDSRAVIAKLSNNLRTTLNVDKIYQIIDETLTGAFHCKAIGYMRYDKKNGDYHITYNHGFENHNRTEFPGNRLLHELYIANGKSIVIEDLKNMPDVNYNATVRMLSLLNIEVLTPLNIKDKTIGLIALGQKESGDMYNDEDINMMDVISAQAAIALENATLYEKVKRFNIKLKKEVEKATEELVKANEQLKQLDQAKSDFISIASHQLRTPLTVVKGYVSMILERNFGEVGEKQVGPLEKVYESNERLIQLVENLLNVSRIESGRLQFSFKEYQLEDMVDSVVEELSSYAKKKNLNLVWNRPASPLPKVYIDEEKVRQVVMNLTDNSIKYTQKGTVSVSLKQVGDDLQFCVSDSGMGILASDLPNLFKKFSRGTGTSLVHTEGTGLGLYVARQMIEAHKGKTWAESEGEYKGSKFFFTLPIIK